MSLLLALVGCGESLVSPTPSLDGADPGLVCGEQLTTAVTVTGAGLAPLPTEVVAGPATLELPELRLEPVSALDGGAATGASVDLAGRSTWTTSGEMSFEVTPDLGVGAGVYDLVVANPDGQEATLAGGLAVTAAPVLSSVEPEIFCADEAPVTLTLVGEGFLVVEGALPTVTLGGFTAPADAAGACVPLAGPVEGELCGELTVTVPVGGIAAGAWEVTVTNPAPAGCSSTEAVPIEVVGAPVIEAVDPAGTCTEATDPIELTLSGSGFLSLEGQLPTVTLGGLAMEPVTLGGCAPLTVGDGERCTTLSFTVPGGAFPTEGDQPIVVTNPPPADCSAEATWSVLPPPVLTALEPPQICDDGSVPQLVAVRGDHFADGYVVTLTDAGGATSEVPTTFVSSTELQADVAGFPAGLYDVGVEGPGGCASTTLPLEIVEEPLVFFVDPPVVYDGASLVATVFVSGIHGEVTDVSVTEVATGTVTTLEFVYDPSLPTLVYVTIPSGLPVGAYDLTVSDAATCHPTLEDAFEVDGTLDLALVGVDPAFGWTDASTAIAVTADPASGFVDLPRVYLADAAGGGTAIALDAVTFQDPGLVDAVVPALPVGSYDVIVVNPTGEIGRLPAAFQSVADPPPVIEGVAPASVASDIDHPILVTGRDFRAPAVSLECVDPVGALSFVVPASDVPVTTSSSTTLVATVPSSSDPDLRGGAVCVVVVTNGDGTFGRYAALSVTNPSQNLYPWRVGSPLTRPRTGLVAAAGRSTSVSRWLYAIGGDDGAGGVHDTIERARVDAYGNLGAFEELPQGLPGPRTRAAVATLGRFVYVVGGTDGAAVSAEVLRAQILDPLQAPVIDPALVVDVDPAAGLGEGTYVYRVSARFGPGFDDNPSGESLPSDPFVVRLPDAAPDLLQVTLSWSPVAGAAGYRVYRSDTGSGGEAMIAEVPASTTILTDAGLPADPAVAPLPPGSLGRFAALDPLPRPLDRPAAAIALDPSDPSVAYLYVAGGRDGGGVVRDEVHFLPIALASEHDHEAGAWSTSARRLAAGRYALQARALTATLHSLIAPPDAWIYFGPGLGAGGVDVARVDAMRPGPGGEPVEAWDVPGAPQAAGYGMGHASNFLYVFGGDGGGGPVASGVSAGLCEDGTGPCNGGPPEPPDLQNWNSLGVSLSSARTALGSAQESSVIFAVGGDDGSGATTTVDFTNY